MSLHVGLLIFKHEKDKISYGNIYTPVSQGNDFNLYPSLNFYFYNKMPETNWIWVKTIFFGKKIAMGTIWNLIYHYRWIIKEKII